MPKKMRRKQIKIIPAIHGKLTREGKLSEPDVYWILEKWLERHPEVTTRQKDIRITRGQRNVHPLQITNDSSRNPFHDHSGQRTDDRRFVERLIHTSRVLPVKGLK